MIEEELDAARWMMLLDEVREELGEGKIGGIAFERRLEFSSPKGNWDLSLVESRLGGHSTQYRFFGRTVLPAAFHLGPGRDLQATKSWTESEFDAEVTLWTATPALVRTMLSDPVRKSISELRTFHPALSLTVYPRSVTIVLPGVFFDRAGIIEFLLVAGACVQELLKGSGGVE